MMPSNKKFGYSFAFIFFFISIYAFFINSFFVLFISITISFIFIIISIIVPKYLTYINLYWYRFGILLGKIINPVVMGFIFFVIFTPFSLFFAIIGRDELSLKKKKKKSYWKKRKIQSIDGNSFNNQY
tara:strand:+ start:50 stop:433 length:384 start_codon:yes stop_codon:yes gene_type:complete